MTDESKNNMPVGKIFSKHNCFRNGMKMASENCDEEKKFEEMLKRVEEENKQELKDIDEWGDILLSPNDSTHKND
ncbi:hypothetical protein LOK69_00480 [Escherichia coli]|uniref:hypothetical protein n=1 Tax=Escherichia coli TaxID=562 RepID=UPI001E322135|nr:hypothetical protein [Escherichia coli]MCC9296983.1 hypothetical protein [Escherichia coli]MCC9301546.1 hypothetical protein [Escherichia coli]MCZ0409742.1 hypothetical protein [Escherichia coli]UIR42856.1 hypothetical protein LZ175_06020 [Escherichia coli]UUF71446.1 hypothetical protein NPX81_06025 [Escherichia coli]